MERKIFSDDSMINRAANAPGADPDGIERLIGSDPRAAGLLSRLSPEDIGRLRQILGDPEQLSRLLSSPQAQKLLSSLKKGGGI